MLAMKHEVFFFDEECQSAYEHLLVELDNLSNDSTSLCVHDAHQGALRACEALLPGKRNARCYYHFSKNIKDNRSKFGVDAAMVEHLKYALHASPTDDFYFLLAIALIHEVEEEHPSGANYLRYTLDSERYGFPNIALTSAGLQGTQVLNNIVEAFHRNVTRMLGRNNMPLSIFVERILEILRSLRHSSPQHFVRRPETIDVVEYQMQMMLKGTRLVSNDSLKEVTTNVNELMGRPTNDAGVRYFLVDSRRIYPHPLPEATNADIDTYLRGLLLSEFPREGQDMSLDEVLARYYRFNLLTASETEIVCTCKEWRDWGRCGHGYGVEIIIGTQIRLVKQLLDASRLSFKWSTTNHRLDS
ncbi:hypothetical protein FOZ61_006786 [Perkinsus olseni]|uniref:SWIM-type domain-containing protein n=1 Tax=Perkinsus olseni TaxID=32597 RepID=A0A7J6LBG3_PEROL|nr:hypothetical protein FOZ61_006786 [Perkinsus olseni]